ncbi:hypothetical protein Acr_00g0038690 [Actinidia rufa]|uniref:Uncharacterized protein n=1 Tax=Actinidia rufa TaxID=165716 RepID=A0A7J0DH93_9ERIC|nr:hypothetical protein Acr_00g0038690 [Actinidia rufa]
MKKAIDGRCCVAFWEDVGHLNALGSSKVVEERAQMAKERERERERERDLLGRVDSVVWIVRVVIPFLIGVASIVYPIGWLDQGCHLAYGQMAHPSWFDKMEVYDAFPEMSPALVNTPSPRLVKPLSNIPPMIPSGGYLDPAPSQGDRGDIGDFVSHVDGYFVGKGKTRLRESRSMKNAMAVPGSHDGGLPLDKCCSQDGDDTAPMGPLSYAKGYADIHKAKLFPDCGSRVVNPRIS